VRSGQACPCKAGVMHYRPRAGERPTAPTDLESLAVPFHLAASAGPADVSGQIVRSQSGQIVRSESGQFVHSQLARAGSVVTPAARSSGGETPTASPRNTETGPPGCPARRPDGQRYRMHRLACSRPRAGQFVRCLMPTSAAGLQPCPLPVCLGVGPPGHPPMIPAGVRFGQIVRTPKTEAWRPALRGAIGPTPQLAVFPDRHLALGVSPLPDNLSTRRRRAWRVLGVLDP
jgi:hypothetical protein